VSREDTDRFDEQRIRNDTLLQFVGDNGTDHGALQGREENDFAPMGHTAGRGKQPSPRPAKISTRRLH
jgi:hypothetical protein